MDVTATPKHNNAAIFVQTVADYPLVEAISQNVVKHPVLPDAGSKDVAEIKEIIAYSQLRAGGVRVDLYPDKDRYGRQFKYAEDRGIRYALLLSPREIEAEVVAAKDLVTGDQVDVPAGDLVAWLQARLEKDAQ
jgi:histidyl-tRNA synthetase